MVEFLVGIVSYNPSIESFKNNLKRIKYSDILIVDNGSKNKVEIESVCKRNNVKLIKNSRNLGIASALNQIFSYAKKKRYTWVLTLDQDSQIDETVLKHMKKCKNNQAVGIYCPQIYDYIANVVWPQTHLENSYTEITRCITSGSLTSVSAWDSIGGFDEYLFIDEVDNDFCYRLRKQGYKILLIPHTRMKHKVGKTKVRNFLGIKLFIRNHSAMRKYYITRNRLYLDKKYYKKIRIKTIAKSLLFILKTFAFENDKLEKLKACGRGFRDAVKK